MQAGRGLVKDIYGLARRALGKLCCELDTLRLPAREGRGGLANLYIAEADVIDGFELAIDARHGLKEIHALLNRHLKHVVYAHALELYI